MGMLLIYESVKQRSRTGTVTEEKHSYFKKKGEKNEIIVQKYCFLGMIGIIIDIVMFHITQRAVCAGRKPDKKNP